PAYPLVGPGALLICDEARLFEVATAGEPRLLRAPIESSARLPSLRYLPVEPAVANESLFVRWRSSEREMTHTFEYDAVGPRSEPVLVFHEPGLLPLPGAAAAPRGAGAAARVQALAAGWNIPGTPVTRGTRTFIPLCRGFREIELAVAAADLLTGECLWRRPLGSVRIESQSTSDVAALLPEMQLIAAGGDLIAVHAGGWLARLCQRTGEYRGVIAYPSFGDGSEEARSRISILSHVFRRAPAVRRRHAGPPVLAPRTHAHGPLLIVAPPDARALLAVDLDRWEVEWRHEMAAESMALGCVGERIALLDAGIARGGHEAVVRLLDLDSGRIEWVSKLALRARVPEESAAADRDLHPLLVGVPRLAGEELWIPTLAGLEIWSLGGGVIREALGGGAEIGRPADRVIAWPEGSPGGTPIPLGGCRLATVYRSDHALPYPSMLEILAGP
ncbi:MAG: hypothetical protein L0Z55_10510, partial [Planctomycetes bacterium]|nr:hypothetical protein [Planctomycetota bacterium]